MKRIEGAADPGPLTAATTPPTR